MLAPLTWVLGLLVVIPLAAAQSEHDLSRMWQRFQVDYKRTYSTEMESAKRFTIFKANVLTAMQMNAQQGIDFSWDLFDDPRCVFGITKFSDKFPEELRRTLPAQQLALSQSHARVPVLSTTSLLGAGYEKAVDWRVKGVVTPVRNQNKCGSCWAFSIAQQMESAHAIDTGMLLNLTQQQILSCDKNCVGGVGDCGCDGGDVVTGCEYVQKVGGLATLDNYPDTSSSTGITGNCSSGFRRAVRIKQFSYAVPPCNHSRDPRDERPCDAQDEVGLAKVVASKGPVSVSLTWGPGWWSYKGGVYDSTCSNTVADIDHAMQIVGYDMSGAKPYWIVRNTFGTDFGIGGYIHIAMGKNKCGIANEAVVVEVEPAILESARVVV